MMHSRCHHPAGGLLQPRVLRVLILSGVCLCFLSSVGQKTQAEEQAGPRRTSLSSPSRSRMQSDTAGRKRTLKLKTSQQEVSPTPAGPEFFKARELSETEKHVTLEQAEEFVDRVYQVLWWESEEKLFAESRFGELICDGLPLSTPQLQDFQEQFGSRGASAFVKKMKVLVEQGDDYSLQKIYLRNDRRYVRFRVLLESGSLNYHEFPLINLPSGVFAENVFALAAGESHSETMHRIFAPILEDQQLGLLKFIPGMRSPLVQNLNRIGEMGQSLSSDPPKSLAIYDSLPESVQQERIVMLLRVFAASGVEDETLYSEAISDFQRRFPNDPSALLLSIDQFMLQEKYAECLQAVNSLDEAVGGDPYLDIHRAAIAIQVGERDRGIQLALRVSEALPSVLMAHWMVMGVLLRTESHPETLDLLKFIDERFEMNWHEFSEVEEYSKFTKTPQYDEWLKYRREQEKKKPVPIEQTL